MIEKEMKMEVKDEDKKLEVRIMITPETEGPHQGEISAYVLYAFHFSEPGILLVDGGGITIEFALLDLIKTLTKFHVDSNDDMQEACRLIEMALNAFDRNDAINWGELDEFLSMNYEDYKPRKDDQEDGEGGEGDESRD